MDFIKEWKLDKKKNKRQLTYNIQNWGLIGYSRFVTRIKCRVA